MLDRAALDVDRARDADPDRAGRQARRRGARRPAPRSAPRPSAPGSVGSRTCSSTWPVGVDDHAEGLGGADVEADRGRSPAPLLSARRPTGHRDRAGTSPRASTVGRSSVRRPGQPHSTTTDPAGRGGERGVARRAAGARRGPGRTQRPAPGRSGEPRCDDARRPAPPRARHRRRCCRPSRPAPRARRTATAAVPDAVTERRGAVGQGSRDLGVDRSRGAGRRDRRAARPRWPPRPAVLVEPAGPDRGDDRGLDVAHQRRRPCPRRGRAGRRRRPARAPRPRGCRGRRRHPAMSSASLTITPSKPEPVAQQGEHRRAQRRRAGRVERGDHDVRGHHRRRPGLDRGRERHQLPRRPASAGRRRAPAGARWLSSAVSPWPGKCLAHAATPADCSPSDPRGDVRGDPRRVGAEAAGADHRVVRVGVHVGDRAEVEVDAERGELERRSRGRSPGSARGRRRHRAPAARGTGLPSATCSRVTSPPSSSTAITAPGEAARTGGGVRRDRVRPVGGVAAEQAAARRVPPRAARARRATPSSRGTTAAAPGGRGRPASSSLHRPGGESGDHPALDDQEEDDRPASRSASSRPSRRPSRCRG